MKKTRIIGALAGLAQDTRLDIFRLLVQSGPDGLAAGLIGKRLDLPLPTLSFHLAQLKHAGLIDARRQSRSIIYSANFQLMNDLIAYLTENCCGGKPELCFSAPSIAATKSMRQKTAALKRNGREPDETIPRSRSCRGT
jgi:ArsR family transcriptional regulator